MRARLVFSLAVIGIALAACRKPEPEESPVLSTPEPSATAALTDFRIGVVPVLGAAPIIIARTQGLFEKHGLDVSFEILASTDAVAQELTTGKLDAGILFPADALLLRGTNAFQVSCVLARNAGGISVSPGLWQAMEPDLLRNAQGELQHPIHADALALALQRAHRQDIPVHFQIESPRATHTYALHYWLAASGITTGETDAKSTVPHPFLKHAWARIALEPAPPTAMNGYAGNSWNAPKDHIGVIAVENIVRDLPSAVFASRTGWTQAHEDVLVQAVAALIEAGQWLDAKMDNRRAAATDLAEILGLDVAELTPLLTGSRRSQRGASGHVIFAENGSAAPDHPTSLWILSQMARHGQLPRSLDEQGFHARVEETLRPDIFLEAMRSSGATLPGIGMRLEENATLDHVIDGNRFDPRQTVSHAGPAAGQLP